MISAMDWTGVTLLSWIQFVAMANDVAKPGSDLCIAFESSYHIDRGIIQFGMWPGCECIVFESYGRSQGVFNSINFPANYPINLNCVLYTFIGDLDEIVELTFVEFDLHPPSINRSCTDFVRLYLKLERPEVNGRPTYELCGDLSSSSSSPVAVQRTYFSSKRSVIVELHTDSVSTNHRGFRGTYRFIEKAQFETVGGTRRWDTSCSYDFYSNKMTKSGTFFSPRYPQNYPSNSSCHYFFYGGPEDRIRITIVVLQLDGASDIRCQSVGDVITVRDGVDVTSPVISRHCGTAVTPVDVTSTGENASVEFTSDGRIERQGFAATFQFFHRRHVTSTTSTSGAAVEPSSIMTTTRRMTTRLIHTDDIFVRPESSDVNTFSLRDSPVIAQSVGDQLATSEGAHRKDDCLHEYRGTDKRSGTVTSPRYPNPYPADQICRYIFIGQGRERVQLTFIAIELNSVQPGHSRTSANLCDDVDSVTVTVYVADRPMEFGVYCGSYGGAGHGGGSRKLPSLLSADQRLELVFHSRANSVAPVSSTKTDNVMDVVGFEANFLFTSDYGIKTGEQDVNQECSFAYRSKTSSNGTFASPNYPGLYPRSTECHYLFYGWDVGERVHIKFLYFEIDGVPPGCLEQTESDYIEFSNFNVQLSDRKLSRQCGNKHDNSLTSGTFISDSNFFRVTFRSNAVYDANGFLAHYQFKRADDSLTVGARLYTSSSSFGSQLRLNTSMIVIIVFLLLLSTTISALVTRPQSSLLMNAVKNFVAL